MGYMRTKRRAMMRRQLELITAHRRRQGGVDKLGDWLEKLGEGDTGTVKSPYYRPRPARSRTVTNPVPKGPRDVLGNLLRLVRWAWGR